MNGSSPKTTFHTCIAVATCPRLFNWPGNHHKTSGTLSDRRKAFRSEKTRKDVGRKRREGKEVKRVLQHSTNFFSNSCKQTGAVF